jgi:hypothetical protein
MKFVFRWLFRLLILAIVLAVAAVLLKDVILKEVLESRLRAATGLETRIGRLHVALLAPTVTIENFRLYSPPEYGGGAFLDLPELHVEYDRQALAARRLHLKLVRLHLAELVVVQKPGGGSNLEAMGAFAGGQPKSSPGQPLDFWGIDTLSLTLGKIKRCDLAAPQQVQVINLDLQNETVRNIKTELDLYLALGRLAVKVGLRELSRQVAKWEQAMQQTNRLVSPAPVPALPSSRN